MNAAIPFFRSSSPTWLAASVALVLALVPSLGQTAKTPLSVALAIADNAGVVRHGWPARGGVPFPPGELDAAGVADLAVVDQQGNAVPAQFEPFVLWWGRDRSVKWLLVDVLAEVPPHGKAHYRLVRKQNVSEGSLRVSDNKSEVVVHTGRLKAVISKDRGTILDRVYLDADHDGEFASDELVIRPDRLNGSIAVSNAQDVVYGQHFEYNMWGHGGGRIEKEAFRPAGRLAEHTYASGLARPERVVVEAQGPVRATVRIEGRHLPRSQGSGVMSEGFLDYTVWLHFHADKPSIQIEHSLDNQRQDYPMHIYRIKEARLQFAMRGMEGASCVIGTEDEKTVKAGLQGRTVSLLQDSANLDRWDLYNRLRGKHGKEAKETPGYFFRAKAMLGPAVFRGYKVVEGRTWSGDDQMVISQGDHSPGWGAVDARGRGVSLFMQRMWMECPKAMRFSGRKLEAVFFPEFSPEQFQIHSSARKSHELTLAFHGSRQELARAHRDADGFLHPLVLRAQPEQYARSMAYPRHLGIQRLEERQDRHWYPHSKWNRNILTANWRTLGLKEHFNGGGMHPNYWSLFQGFLRDGGLKHWERGKVHAKWASEWIPWLIHDYSFSPQDPMPQHRLVGWGPKKLFTHKEAIQIEGWVDPYTTNIPAFSSPDKFHLDGEHLMHMWPMEWFFLSGSPIARQSVMAIGNQAKYSTHRHFFDEVADPPPSLDRLFYFDDQNHPERIPDYFYTRIYASHLLSTAWTYGATGDEWSLFYSRWLARRMLYLQRENAGVLRDRKGWARLPPWMEAEAAIAAYALFRETGDEALLDIMGAWLEFAWHEAYEPGKGMPHRFARGQEPEKFEHHWYPGVAAPLCYDALGDPKALRITTEWAQSPLPHIHKGEFLQHPAGQSAAFVLTYLLKNRKDTEQPEGITDLKARPVKGGHVMLSWTAPKDRGSSSGSASRYWIKIAPKPIVDHPSFPEELGSKLGFYQADNIENEPVPSKGGTLERFLVEQLRPHGAYGSSQKLTLRDLGSGTFFFAVKSWDQAGNLSAMSNVARVKID